MRMAENNGLSKIIQQATEQGAPTWGVTLIVQIYEIRRELREHLEEHKHAREPLRVAYYAIIAALAVALLWFIARNAPVIVP